MRILPIIAVTAIVSGSGMASENRELGAHEHGVGHLNIAFDGSQIAMELHAPGSDIVGFEYNPQSADDKAAIDAAVATLARPLELFVLPAAAGCSVIQASAALESERHDDDHGNHDEHAHDNHAHEKHDGHDHDAHNDAGGHTEFHAEYLLNCADATAAQNISFAYFEIFPNAKKLEVQVLSGAGASAFDVARDAPSLDLRGMF